MPSHMPNDMPADLSDLVMLPIESAKTSHLRMTVRALTFPSLLTKPCSKFFARIWGTRAQNTVANWESVALAPFFWMASPCFLAWYWRSNAAAKAC